MDTSRRHRPHIVLLGFTSFEILLIFIVLTFPIVYWGVHAYERGKTEKLLNTLPGVEVAYFDRAAAPERIFHLSADAYSTNASGHYRDVLGIWILSLREPELKYGGKAKPAWLISLEKQERAEAQRALMLVGATLDELQMFHDKLDEISPQLSKAEAAAVKNAANPVIFGLLAKFKRDTADKIVVQLRGLGASPAGLAGNHIGASSDYD